MVFRAPKRNANNGSLPAYQRLERGRWVTCAAGMGCRR